MAITAINTNKGIDYNILAKLVAGDIADYSGGYIALGTSNVDVADGQTSLQGTTAYVAMDAGYPMVDPDNDGSTQKIRFKGVIDDTTANFDIQEWGITTTNTGDNLLLRVVEDFGVKDSGTFWEFKRDITISEVV